MAPISASLLSRRYTLVVAACALPLLILIGVLAIYQFNAQRRAEFETLAAAVSQTRLIVEGVVKDAADHLVQLKFQAEDLLSGGISANGRNERSLLSPSSPEGGNVLPDGLTLDGAERGQPGFGLGNIFVVEDRLATALPGELEMALALFGPKRLTHIVRPNLRWSYYISASGAFMTMYPFVSRGQLVEGFDHASIRSMVDHILSLDVYLDATPPRNSDMSPKWSQPYLDGAGTGWMVSNSVLVTAGDRYVGVLGTDLLLSHLDETLGQLPLKAGRLWIVDSAGNLIADRAGTPTGGSAPRHIRSVLPSRLGDAVALLPVILEPGRHEIAGHHVVAASVAGTPWTLLFVVAGSELSDIAGNRIIPYGIILAGLLATIVVAHFTLRSQFIRPAIQLTEHLQAESEGADAKLPAPALWRPWFKRISAIFEENREAMRKLAGSEQRYRDVVEAQTDFVLRMTPDGRLTFVNDAYCRYHGRSREELLSPDWCDYDVLSPSERTRFLDHLARLTPEAPVASIELQNLLPGFPVRWSAWIDRGIFNGQGRLIEVQSVGRDVTERVIAEQARQETERLRRTALEAALDGYVGMDQEGKIIEFNAAAEAIFGYSREEAVGRRIEVPARRADGSVLPIEIVIVRGVVSEKPVFIAYLRDLTEQKKAAAALAEREAQFRAIAEGVPLSIIISAIDEPEVFFVNERAQQTLGLRVGQKGDTVVAIWKHAEHRTELAKRLEVEGIVDAFETAFTQSDGREMQALVSARRIEHHGRAAVLAAVTDITRQREAEAELAVQREALHQSEKLTALGSLLAGVAHELNNPLSVVVGYSSMLQELSQDPGITSRAEKIHAAAERCSRIVRTFLAMARKRPPSRGMVDVNQVVEAALELSAYGLRSAGIEIGTELETDLPMVWGDEDQLHQVVTNLVINAQQALLMSEPPRRLTVSTRSDDDTVEVIIHDNGPGIPEEVRTRIFEPFFTTKDAGSGTGVGLSVCRAIVTAHEGRIEVETAPGGSTAIIVRLPLMQREKPAAEAEADHEKDMPAISANVLVLDDEADIATMIAEILRRDGHVVEIAKDALSALRIIEHADVDLIVSDLRMPGLDGPGLYQAIREKRPELIDRLLFITGDVLAADIDRFLTRTGAAVVEKPLDPAAFRRAVAGRLIEMEGDVT